MRPVILDTDIGSNVDDILALVMLAKSPELQLIGITTVYGDTIHRARIAQATCAMLERPDIKIIAGVPEPISGRPEKDVRQIATLPNQLGTTLEDEIRTWWTFRDLDRNHPHDPLAGLAMIHPEIFRFEFADVRVGRSSRDFAKTIVTNPGKGAVRLASDVLVRTAEQEIVRRIVA
jgi:inosine-uridine nucleoside N-ribohydrolase